MVATSTSSSTASPRNKKKNMERYPTGPIQSFPGGAYKLPNEYCGGPLTCPVRLKDLAGPLKKQNAENITVKVRVKSKSELKRGVFQDKQPWSMFFMHVLNLASDKQVEMYVKVPHSAQQHYDFIEAGKAYYFCCVELIVNPKQFSKLDTQEFGLTFTSTTTVLLVNEEIETLQEMCLRVTGEQLSLFPKRELMMPILEKLPLNIVETLFRGRYLTFEAICALYSTQEYHNLISSYTMAGYILTRETCTIHSIIQHRYSGMYQNLHCVYDDLSPFMFTKRDEYEERLTKLLVTELSETEPTEFPIVTNLSDFKNQFSLFTRNLLRGINWNNVLCAGGSVLASLLPLPAPVREKVRITTPKESEEIITQYYQNPSQCFYWNSDIDLFLYGLHTDEEVDKKLAELVPVIMENIRRESGVEEVFIVRTLYTVSIVSQCPFRIIQLVLFPYTSLAHVLVRFDIDCVCVGFDGERVWASQRGIRGITKRYNLIDIDRQHLAYPFRLYKYSTRGFCVAMPNEDFVEEVGDKKNKCSYQSFRRLRQGSLLKKLKEKIEKTKLYSGPPEYSANIPWGKDVTTKEAKNWLMTHNVRVANNFDELSASRVNEADDIYRYWVLPEKDPSAHHNWRIPNKTVFAECWYLRPQAWTAEGSFEESHYYTRISGPWHNLLPTLEDNEEHE